MKLKKMMVTLGVTAAMAPLLVVPTPAQSQILPPLDLPITDLVDVGLEPCAVNALGTCTNNADNDGIINMGTIEDSILNSGTIEDSNVINDSAVIDSQLVAGDDNTAVFDRRVRRTTRFIHDDDDDVVVVRRHRSGDRVVVVDDSGSSGGGAAAAASSSAAAASGGGGAAAAASSSAAAAS